VLENVMSERINYQVIEQDGKPAFVVLPYNEFMAMIKKSEEDINFPDEVVRLNIIEGLSLLRAWREYKGLTQKQVAKKAGISQPALVRMEQPGSNLRKDTLLKLARALDLSLEQLSL